MRHLVAPSILAADKNNLLGDVKRIEKFGADYLHFDVMDGIFVPNVSFSHEDFLSLYGKHSLINDVHIMVSNPKEEGTRYAKEGADIVTFHYEACKNDEEVFDVINAISSAGAKVGLSIKPNTPVEVLIPFIDKVFMVLIMSVEPGFGGQKFIPSAVDKIKYLRNFIDSHNLKTLIEVDGGINKDTLDYAKEAGVDVLVAGSYVYKSVNIEEAINSLK